MGSTLETPLDERMWRDPVAEQELGGIHSNTILFYFARSPFFDPTSNNGALFTQAVGNLAMFHLIETRKAFEGRLSQMAGVEFVVTHDPLEPPYAPYRVGVVPSNIWVMQKRHRRKQYGSPDEVSVLATYFVLGDMIFLAPSIADVLASRMLSTVTSLNKLLSTASTLPTFSPSQGYTYLPPGSKPPNDAGTTHTSRATSREGTPVPDSQSFTSSSKGSSPSKIGSSFSDSQVLTDAFSRSARYGTEYMDENPLIGEPGAFILSKTNEKPPPQSSSQLKQSTSPLKTSKTNTPIPSPMEIKTDGLTLGGSAANKKGSQGGNLKSPTTPGGANKEKPKRRKSKAPGSAGA